MREEGGSVTDISVRRDRLSNVAQLVPRTEAGAVWLRENLVTEPWQWLGADVAVDVRCLDAVLSGAQQDGLAVEIVEAIL